jgi:ectoine hydroxylase-related dioxygenase (phytanoyl-CoA dioxygenase family)
MEALRAQYEELGYCLLPNIFTPEQLEPMRRRLAREVAKLAGRLHDDGRVTKLHEDAPLEKRLALLGCQTNVAKRSWGDACQGEELYPLMTHPPLLDAVQELIGVDTLYLHGCTTRPKLPASCAGAEVASQPYHQDSQYFNTGSDGVVRLAADEGGANSADLHIVSCWTPMSDVTLENGGLTVLAGSHCWGLQPGQRGSDSNMRSTIDPLDRDPAPTRTPVDCRVGDVICFSNLTMHGSGANHSAAVRWSLDWRFSAGPGSNRIRDPPMSEAERLASEGYVSQLQRARSTLGAGQVVRAPVGQAVPTWEQWEQATHGHNSSLPQGHKL